MSTTLSMPTSDFIATTLNGALAAAATTATIGTGLDIPATNGILMLDPDSTTAVGSDNGPETVSYATYTSGTGALTGMVRGLNGTTDVAHANGAKVSAGYSTSHIKEFCGARVSLSATQANLTDNTPTKVALDTEQYDIGGNFAANKFVAPVNGYYKIDAQVCWSGLTTATKTGDAYIYKDGAVASTCYGGLNLGGSVTNTLSDVLYLAATSYIELYARSRNGDNNADVTGGQTYYTYMAIHLIREV